MSNYIDLVLCQHENGKRPLLFEAPFCCGIVAGDTVVVDTRLGEAEAVVKAVEHVGKDSDTKVFMMLCAGATEPLKRVLKKVTYRELVYEEGDENEQPDND